MRYYKHAYSYENCHLLCFYLHHPHTHTALPLDMESKSVDNVYKFKYSKWINNQATKALLTHLHYWSINS